MTIEPPSPSDIALACSLAKSPLTARNTTSHSLALATSKSSTSISPNLPASFFDPADLSLPNTLSLDTSNDELFKHEMISFPTAPVAPTTATEQDIEIDDDDLFDICFGKYVLEPSLDDSKFEVEEETKEDERVIGLNPKATDADDNVVRIAAAWTNFISIQFTCKRCIEKDIKAL